jgi:hypothetical protein
MPQAPFPVQFLFIATVAAIIAVLVWAFHRLQGQRYAVYALLGSMLWLALSGGAALSGVLADFSARPPAFALLLSASLLLTCSLAFSAVGDRMVTVLGIVPLIAFQVFRLPVELFLHGMYQAGIAPVQMTYAGLNYDILSGLSAPIVAYLAWRGILGRRGILIWNLAGLALLATIVTVAILSAPFPFRQFHNEPANTFVTHFPYVWLPAVLVQAALLGHLLVFRWLRRPSR